jgi:hypothetical protein
MLDFLRVNLEGWKGPAMIKERALPPESIRKLGFLPGFFEDCGSIEFAYLFGSLARSSFSPLADIDIAVYLLEAKNLLETKMDLLGRLNDFLGTDEIDLVVLNTAPISLLGRILMQKRLVFCRNDFLRHRFESFSLRKYFDFRILEEKLLFRRFKLGG